MEVLLKQSFNYARIRVFKNYSDRLTRGIITPQKNSESPTFERLLDEYAHAEPSYPFRLYPKGKKKNYFFYTDNPTHSFVNHQLPADAPEVQFMPINLTCTKRLKNETFDTTKDKHIKANYNNPFAEIEVIRVERWIKRDGDKITLKIFVQHRNRNVNNIYFSKSTCSTTITFNVCNGNFTVILYENGRKIHKKHFYCNSFSSLKQSLSIFYNISDSYVNKKSPIYKEYVNSFDIVPFQLKIKDILGFSDISFGQTSEIVINDFVTQWMKKFSEIKKIKLPDNGERLLKWYYPTEKYLKKNNRKLVAAVLDRFGIKSKLTIKILHEYPATSIFNLVYLCRLFGDDFSKYIGNINIRFFGDELTSDSEDMSVKNSILNPQDRQWGNFIISNTEKENIVHILNDLSLTPYVSRGSISEFLDHFRMIEKLKPYYPELQLNATKMNTFHAEHAYYARLEREIQKGYSTDIIYEDWLINEIEKPIELKVLTEPPLMYFPSVKDRIEYDKAYLNMPVVTLPRVFEPKLLRNSQEYFEEGCYMSHCVGGYIDSDYSIIVSLRLGEERVTCEYSTRDRRCVQAKYFHNQKPPSYFEDALNKLHDRIRMIPLPIKPIDRRKVPIIINGVQVVPDAPIEFPMYIGEQLPAIF